MVGGLAGGALSAATAGGRRPSAVATPQPRTTNVRDHRTVAPPPRAASVTDHRTVSPPPRTTNVRDHRIGHAGQRVSGATTGTAGTAGSQLLRTVARPQVIQALTSLALGGAGRRNIRVGNVNLPIGAITNALRMLLERTEAEAHAWAAGESSGTPGYLLDDAGEYLVDPIDADERADLVLELLASADGFDEPYEFDVDDESELEFVYLDPIEAWSDEDDDDVGELLYEGVDYDALDDDSF